MTSLPLSKQRLDKIVSGAIKNAIDDHGPVTRDNMSSAVKRVSGQIWGDMKETIRKQEHQK